MVNIPMFSSLSDWWDNLKLQIRRTCIDFSSRKRKQLLSERNSLTKRLLRAKLAVFLGDCDQISNVNKLESTLETVINNECEGRENPLASTMVRGGRETYSFLFSPRV